MSLNLVAMNLDWEDEKHKFKEARRIAEEAYAESPEASKHAVAESMLRFITVSVAFMQVERTEWDRSVELARLERVAKASERIAAAEERKADAEHRKADALATIARTLAEMVKP